MTLPRRQFLLGASALTAIGITPAMAAAASPPRRRGVILVGASWCGLCHQAAPILHRAAQQWGWTVLLASADDQPIAPFEGFVPAASHPATAIIGRFPTTIIAEPAMDRIVDAFEGYPGPNRYLARIARGLTGEGGA